MRFISYYNENNEESGLLIGEKIVPIKILNSLYDWDFPLHLDEIFSTNQFFTLKSHLIEKQVSSIDSTKISTLSLNSVKIAPLYRHPSKIWGIGLNYKDHAADLDEKAPSTIPASFIKADSTIIGYGDTIQLPSMAEKITGEAELGLVFGKKCKNVEKENWLEVIAGFTCVIDMTAESILRKNPRYLTISKNFDTFFSFGPVLLTPEEVQDIFNLRVATVLDGKVYAENSIVNMTFPPDFLVSFHSKIMTFLPGDIISTGTPRAVELKNGALVECKIDGFPILSNPVSSKP
jgi:2-keto-4-pentenoate hydratase/2-oxohepta-3-ene-1,7-dioic acid hydratase in catechol pathway